jgi:hypothetical protein
MCPWPSNSSELDLKSANRPWETRLWPSMGSDLGLPLFQKVMVLED